MASLVMFAVPAYLYAVPDILGTDRSGTFVPLTRITLASVWNYDARLEKAMLILRPPAVFAYGGHAFISAHLARTFLANAVAVSRSFQHPQYSIA